MCSFQSKKLVHCGYSLDGIYLVVDRLVHKVDLHSWLRGLGALRKHYELVAKFLVQNKSSLQLEMNKLLEMRYGLRVKKIQGDFESYFIELEMEFFVVKVLNELFIQKNEGRRFYLTS